MSDTDFQERLGQAEHRIKGFEELAFSFGDILNTRTERYEVNFDEIKKRLDHLDRMVAMLQTDVRDLRSGVTAQLIAQDQRIADVVLRLTRLEDKVASLDARVASIEAILTSMEAGLASLDTKVDTGLASLHTKVDAAHAALSAKLDLVIGKLGA